MACGNHRKAPPPLDTGWGTHHGSRLWLWTYQPSNIQIQTRSHPHWNRCFLHLLCPVWLPIDMRHNGIASNRKELARWHHRCDLPDVCRPRQEISNHPVYDRHATARGTHHPIRPWKAIPDGQRDHFSPKKKDGKRREWNNEEGATKTRGDKRKLCYQAVWKQAPNLGTPPSNGASIHAPCASSHFEQGVNIGSGIARRIALGLPSLDHDRQTA